MGRRWHCSSATAQAKLLRYKLPLHRARTHESAEFFARTFRLQRPLNGRFDTRAADDIFCARAILATSLMPSRSDGLTHSLHGKAKTRAFTRDAKETVSLL
jgi:hypothetical protein